MPATEFDWRHAMMSLAPSAEITIRQMDVFAFDLNGYRFTFVSELSVVAALLVPHNGLVVYFREGYSPVSRSYLILMLTVSVWLFSIALVCAAPQDDIAMRWARVTTLGLTLIPAAMFHFVTLALLAQERKKQQIAAAWISSSFFFALSLGTDYPLQGVYRYPWGYYPNFGPMSTLYLVYFSVILAIVITRLVIENRAASHGSVRWLRARGLLLVIVIAHIAVVDFVGMFGVPLPPVGGAFLIAATALAAGVFWRFRLLDVTPAFAVSTIVDTMSDALLIADPEGVVRHSNAAAARLFGIPQDILEGREVAAVLPSTELTGNIQALFDGGGVKTRETGFESPSLGHRTLSISETPLRDRIARPIAIVYTVQDITEQKHHDDYLDQLAHRDPLTRLPNRLLLRDRMQQGMAQSRRHGTEMAVCYLDLDGFKNVNDRFGHVAGDQVLIEVSRRLLNAVRDGDTVARLGGDEFVVLLQGLASYEEVEEAIGRLLQTISKPYRIGSEETSGISASIGATQFPSDSSDLDTLLRNADHAMYSAKQAGKNGYELFCRLKVAPRSR